MPRPRLPRCLCAQRAWCRCRSTRPYNTVYVRARPMIHVQEKMKMTAHVHVCHNSILQVLISCKQRWIRKGLLVNLYSNQSFSGNVFPRWSRGSYNSLNDFAPLLFVWVFANPLFVPFSQWVPQTRKMQPATVSDQKLSKILFFMSALQRVETPWEKYMHSSEWNDTSCPIWHNLWW